ncbi:MAG: glycosyltransferase family 39 protein [Anaerolineales bacterium]|nr:glycosyltransferase family 39 protein [Anaerolineales bacterium]
MEHTLLALLLLGHFLLAFAYSALNPLGEAPDEADHWAFIVHLAREHELPQGAKMTQAKHPPLYHITAALVASISDPTNDFLRANPEVEFAPRTGWSPNFFIHTARERWPWQGEVLAFHLVRLWSVLLSTATVAAVYFLARTALPNQRAVALGATGLLAFLPEFSFIGGSVNNDNAAALFGTLGLWGAFAIMRHGGRWRSWLVDPVGARAGTAFESQYAVIVAGGWRCNLIGRGGCCPPGPRVGAHSRERSVDLGEGFAMAPLHRGAGGWRRGWRYFCRRCSSVRRGSCATGSNMVIPLAWNWCGRRSICGRRPGHGVTPAGCCKAGSFLSGVDLVARAIFRCRVGSISCWPASRWSASLASLRCLCGAHGVMGASLFPCLFWR